MSQMKPYCFKCGAELGPDAIYCPECGRLQRSMVVRASEPGASTPPPPPPGPAHEPPYPFYPDREGTPQAEPPADQSYSYPDASPQQPDQHDPYAREQYPEQGWHGEDQTNAHEPDAWAAQTGDQVYAQQQPYEEQQYGDQSWSDQGQQQPSWYHDPAYGQPETQEHQTYDQQAGGYSQETAAYDQQAYDQQAYDHEAPAEPPAAAPEPPAPWPYDNFDETTYRQPGSPPAEPEPWNRRAEPYTPPEPVYRRPAPPPPPPPVVPPPPPPSYRPAEPAEPAEPVYSSSAPLPRSGGYEPYAASTPSGSYGGDRVPPSNPYAMTTYQPNAAYGPDPTPSRLRVIALVAAAALGLFLVSFAIGHILGVGSGPSAPSAAAPPQQTAGPTTAPTTRPTGTPASTPAPTPTADQGGDITGTAKFQRLTSSIPGRCSTAQGCPVQVVLRNNGGSGSGTITVTLTDDGGNSVGTFTGPIPTTDPGASVTVNGFATGDQLGNYLKGGGIVHITGVDIKDGGG